MNVKRSKMVLLRSCCCWQSIRNGSIASGIYTMTFYSVIVTAGSIHLNTVVNLPEAVPSLLVFSILMVIFAALTVISSIVLIAGLCTNHRIMLLPWIASLTMTTILDIILSFYLVMDSDMDPFFGILIAIDYFICALNVYCILCVTSQYQEYVSGRNRPRQVDDSEGPPAILLEAASTVRPNQSPARMVSISVIRNNGSPTSSICRPLLPSGGTPKSRATVTSNIINSSSPVLMLSRSSFSSTSEISFCSSDLLSSSRRSSALPFQDIKQGLSPVGEVNHFPFSSEVVEGADDGENTEEKTEPSKCTEQISEMSAMSDREEAITTRTSRFRVSSAFSSRKPTQKGIKINILEVEEQPGEDLPSENSHDST